MKIVSDNKDKQLAVVN